MEPSNGVPIGGGRSARTAVVTGATSGIGAATACALAEVCTGVVLVGRDVGRLRETGQAVEAAGAEVERIEADLTSDGTADEIVARTLQRFGSLDVLVHSAGIFEPSPLADADLDNFDRQMALNARAPYALTRAALNPLRDGGVVIFVSSIAGHVAFPDSAAYCASKGAVELMTKALALELAPLGVRVNAVAPGNIRTPMNEELLASAAYEAEMVGLTPAGRVGVVDDIAPVVVFLASDASRYIHGTTVLVDGGWTAR